MAIKMRKKKIFRRYKLVVNQDDLSSKARFDEEFDLLTYNWKETDTLAGSQLYLVGDKGMENMLLVDQGRSGYLMFSWVPVSCTWKEV